MSVRIATVQFAPVFGDKRGNLQKMVKFVEEAAGKGAQLIVFPELATTGYSLMGLNDAIKFGELITPDAFVFHQTKFAPPMDPCQTMRIMQALVLKYDVHIVWGMVEQQVQSETYYNSQVILAPNLMFETYRKVNRWGNDYLWAAAGRSNPAIMTTDLGDGKPRKVGLLICRDVRDKKDDKWSSFYDPGDADIVCMSANFGDGGFPAVSWMEFAEDNKVTFVVSNRYGQEANNNFGEGGICVIEPSGKVHCDGLRWSEDCIVYADIP
jgi:predicted amidohydrolase